MLADETSLVENSWLAFHVFYHGDQDALLWRCVRPLIHELRSGGRISDYFFLRYWNGGPHVRLRVKAGLDPTSTRETIRSAVVRFLADAPGGTAITADQYEPKAKLRGSARGSPVEDEQVEPLRPPDTIDEREYVYEAVRYGNGQAAREATEHHFRFSSDLAMFILGQTLNDMDARLTVALSLTAETARGLGLDTVTTAKTFREASELLNRAFPDARPGHTDPFAARGFPDPAILRPQVAPIVGQIFRGDSSRAGGAELERVLAAWRENLRQTSEAIAASAPHVADSTRYRLVAIDYMHMLNNRLGVPVDQECFAYKLVADALESRFAGMP
jgi:thiopeptide-type bacteriocin biosynthesis protein